MSEKLHRSGSFPTAWPNRLRGPRISVRALIPKCIFPSTCRLSSFILRCQERFDSLTSARPPVRDSQRHVAVHSVQPHLTYGSRPVLSCSLPGRIRAMTGNNVKKIDARGSRYLRDIYSTEGAGLDYL